jgi:hypothetical protein
LPRRRRTSRHVARRGRVGVVRHRRAQLKVGIQSRTGWLKDLRPRRQRRHHQQYRNGVASQVQVLNTPLNNTVNLNADFGLYAQDMWTMRRFTLSPVCASTT